MKKIIFYAIIAIVICSVGYTFLGEAEKEMITGGLDKRIATADATTTPIWLEPTTSTTTDEYVISSELVFSTRGMNGFDMNIIQTASSSAQLQWNYWFSDDGDTWYPEEGITDTNDLTMTHGSSTYAHVWSTNVTTTEYKNTHYPSTAGDVLRADYTKVIFSVNTASTSMYAEILK